MTVDRVTRWWPVVAVLAMAVLGLVVGSGTTPVDAWFLGDARNAVGADVEYLIVLSHPLVLGCMLLVAVVVALARRRWRLAAVAVVTPFVGVAIERVCKPVFGRYSGEGLAYPSGHTTVLVVTLGMIVLAVGPKLWLMLLAAVPALWSMIGIGMTFHYFTDTVGGLFLGTALLCVAARIAGLVPRDQDDDTTRGTPVPLNYSR